MVVHAWSEAADTEYDRFGGATDYTRERGSRIKPEVYNLACSRAAALNLPRYRHNPVLHSLRLHV